MSAEYIMVNSELFVIMNYKIHIVNINISEHQNIYI